MELKGVIELILVSRENFDRLRKANLIKFGSDKNYQITSRNKSGGRKKYYVVESRAILNFLGLPRNFKNY